MASVSDDGKYLIIHTCVDDSKNFVYYAVIEPNKPIVKIESPIPITEEGLFYHEVNKKKIQFSFFMK